MKKYLIKGALALFAGAFLFSCAEKESEYVPLAQQKAKAFDDVFKEVYGDNIDPYQKWGFSDKMVIANGDSVEFEDLDDVVAGSRNRTRAGGTRTSPKPSTPSFSSYDANKRPATPSFATTLAAAKAAGAVREDSVTSWSDGLKVYIDKDHNWTDGNKSSLTIYVNGDVKYYSGVSNNGDGTTFVVLENSTLHLSSFGDNLKVYLAPNAVLDLTKSYDGQGNENTNFDGKVSFYSKNSSTSLIYLSSTSRVTGTNITFKDGCKVLNNGGTISAANINVENSAVLWNEGTVTTSANLSLGNMYAYVYNATGKSITVSGNIYLTNNYNIFYNDGRVTCSGNVTLQNDNAEFINENSATLTVSGSYSTAAGGKTYNEGTVNITGNTNLSNSNSKGWVNDGNWTCGSFTVDQYSHSNFNNCFLTVNGEFYLNCGTFVNNAGALVTCNSFKWINTSDFYLGGKSKLDVKGTLTTNNYDIGYGFRGFGDDYAIISATEIAKGLGNVQYSMSYYGNLFIDTNKHFEQGYISSNGVDQPYYWYENTVKFKFKGEGAPFTYVKKSCGGYSPTPGNGSDSQKDIKNEDVWSQVTSQTGRVFCEDLGQATREDLDYNDVVFDVIIWKYKSWTTTTTTTTTWKTTDNVEVPGTKKTTKSTAISNLDSTYYAQITLLAAGGTLPLTVAGVEVHDAFGVGETTMVNTVNDYSTVYGNNHRTLKPVAIGDTTRSVKYNGETKSLKLFEGYKTSNSIPIIVNYNGKSINELSATGGKAPHKLFVPLDTKWAVERKNLALAYPDFVNYVSDSNKDWTRSNTRDEYYMYTQGETRGLSVMPTVIKNRRTYVAGKEKNLWTGPQQTYGSSWSLNNVSTTFDVDVLYPGDRLRFYAKGIGNEAWINVSINNAKPYLLDSNFPNYVYDAKGNKTILGADDEGFIEVLLDENTAAMLNSLIDEGKSFVVQGRNFTLTRIAVVEFD